MNGNNVNPTRPQQRPQISAPMIDFKEFWALAVINWRWFVVSVVSCILLAGVYLWFTPTSYGVIGKMEIIDKSKKGSGLSAGMAMLNSLPMGLGGALGGSLGGSAGIDAEKVILMSNSLVTNVVKELGLYTEYRLSKWGRKTLLYQDQPVNVALDAAHVEWLDAELPLYFHQINLTISKDDKGYTVETMLKENKEKTYLPDQTFTSLPATIKTDAGVLTLTENKVLTKRQSKKYEDGYTLKVTINPPTEAAAAITAKLGVEPSSKKSINIVAISFFDGNVIRGIDFVNHLVDAYNQHANDDKNEEARKTDEFVNARLAKIDAELGSSDAAWENSKKNFQITDPSIDAEEVMTKKSLYENKLVEIGTELQLHDYLSEYVHNPENLYELIPVGIAGGMGNLSGEVNAKESTSSNASLIAQHNTLVSQRKELLRSMSEKAPQIQRITESIKELHPTLLTAMKRDRQNILMKRNAVEREYSKYMGRVNTAPKMERVLTEIGRQREIKQGVYLLMLQKREETAMELANTTDKGKLIDETRLVKSSITPQKPIILLLAFVIALLLPMGIIYLHQIFKYRIDVPGDLKKVTDLPLIGEVLLNQNEESIRNLRTNLLLNLKPNQKVLMITSGSDGDGKTYIAKHLTESLTAIGKKALYLNADLRGTGNGTHPADYFASNDFAEQLERNKANNDYVIIDTPSIEKYNDACQIAQFADATIYVVKVGKTDIFSINKLKDKSLPNIMFALNAIDMSKIKNQYLFK